MQTWQKLHTQTRYLSLSHDGNKSTSLLVVIKVITLCGPSAVDKPSLTIVSLPLQPGGRGAEQSSGQQQGSLCNLGGGGTEQSSGQQQGPRGSA